MLSIELCNSDDFLSLTNEARQLYFYINLSADDDGFVGNALTVAKIIEIDKKYLDELCEKNYLIKFPGGVYAVKHWCVHNQIRKDRRTPTQYVKEARMLEIDDKVYVFKDEKKLNGESLFFDNHLTTQISSDERSEDELKEEKKRENKNNSDQRSQSVGGETDVENSVENSAENLTSFYEEADKEEDGLTPRGFENFSPSEKAEYRRLASRIQLFFLTAHKMKECDGFIIYNNEHRWRGINGESVKDNLPRYMEGWMEYGEKFYEQS